MIGQDRTIVRNTIFLSLRMLFVLVVSLYTSRVFLNSLGVIDYGISNVVAGFVSMFSFLNSSLTNCIQRFYNAEIGKKGISGIARVYKSAVIIQSVLSIVVLLLLETVGVWYLENKIVIPNERQNVAFWLYQFSCISAIFVIMQSPFSAFVIARERMSTYSIISIVEVLLKLLLAFSIDKISMDKLLVYGFFYMIISVVSFIIYYVYCKVNFRELIITESIDRHLTKEMVQFSSWNICGTFACMAREQGLNIVLNLFFGPMINAARGVAYQVSGALQGFVLNLGLAAKPQMIQSYNSGEKERTIKLMYLLSKFSFYLLLVLSIPIILNLDYILKIWLGDVVPEHTASFIFLVIMINFVNNLNMPLSNLVYAVGKMRNYEIAFTSLNLLILPCSYSVLKLGAMPESVFLVYLSLSIVVQVVSLFVLKHLIDLSLKNYVKELVFPVCKVLSIILPVVYLANNYFPHDFIGIAIEYLLFSVLVSISFYYLALNTEEKRMANDYIKKTLKR